MHRIVAAVAVGTAPAAAAVLNATVDLTAAPTPFRHNWEECVGSGHMLLGTRADWRAHLKLAHDELGMKRIRGHGLLDDDMSVVAGRARSEVAADGSVSKSWPYQFYNVDQVFDYLLSIGMSPVVELSFMPSHFVTCKGPCSYAFGDNGGYKGLIMPPDDFEDWYDLVYTLADHLVQRYTLDVVKTWNFEVWNEMWGISFPDPYMELFNASSRGLKDVEASLRVGGPATMQTKSVPEFIANATAAGIPFDFVSTHFYPTDPQCQTNATASVEDCFVDMVSKAQFAAEKANKPFYLTEYNNGLGATSRDDVSAAAFAFRMMGQVQALDMFSWWTFSDVFEENWMLAAPFHNGYGMMTMQGTRKPVWRAFQVLHQAGASRYAATTPQTADRNSPISVLATTVANLDDAAAEDASAPCSTAGSALNLAMYVASWHRVDAERFSCNTTAKTCAVDPAGSFTDEALCDANCNGAGSAGKQQPAAGAKAPPSNKVQIAITHTADAKVPAAGKLCRMDSTHTNPEAAWQAMGSPVYPTPDQIAKLDAASQLVEEAVTITRVSDTQSVLTVDAEEYAALYIVV